ncbi:hypothetical protein BLOT_010759 [Blomia tropicalis]|nr:hypothetical protein BLOT_010759 [Blomia tropicalis]
MQIRRHCESVPVPDQPRSILFWIQVVVIIDGEMKCLEGKTLLFSACGPLLFYISIFYDVRGSRESTITITIT